MSYSEKDFWQEEKTKRQLEILIEAAGLVYTDEIAENYISGGYITHNVSLYIDDTSYIWLLDETISIAIDTTTNQVLNDNQICKALDIY